VLYFTSEVGSIEKKHQQKVHVDTAWASGYRHLCGDKKSTKAVTNHCWLRHDVCLDWLAGHVCVQDILLAAAWTRG
jgi:hypothetical protein